LPILTRMEIRDLTPLDSQEVARIFEDGIRTGEATCCYGGVAESSVYVAEEVRGRGVGRELLEELIRRSEAAGIWTLQAGIFPENKPSLRLHLVCGFRLVGVRERLGELNGVWRDVLLLERRSEVAG